VRADLRRIACIALLASCSAHPTPAPAPVASASTTAPAASASVAKEDIAPEGSTGYRTGLTSVRAKRQMVTAANPHAARAGREVLRAGGSAVDAAIAMALVLSLVEPQSSGIGGGAFMLFYDAKQRSLRAYDGRETAPAAATGDMFLRDGKPRDFMDAVVGGLSVGVPGELRMLELAHQAHGKLPWKRLFAPAIDLAEKGFKISARLHALLEDAPRLPAMGGAKDYFFLPDGRVKPAGTRLTNPALATVLREVADKGAAAFYEGPIADRLVEAVAHNEAQPGRLVAADLAAYRAVARDAVCHRYREHLVCGMPPPTSGGVTTLQILGLLAPFPLADEQAGGVKEIHLFAEAEKLAFADRDQYLADPDFVPQPVDELLAGGYLAARSKLISVEKGSGAKKAAPGKVPTAKKRADHFAPDASLERPATSHVCVVDAEGNAVSMTASIEGAFGSHVMVDGYLLNNELTDFSFVPQAGGKPVANRVEPGKRPRSSMAPIIVLTPEKELVLVIGSPGGSRIISYVARALVSILDHHHDVQDAMGEPHYGNRNGSTELELRDDLAPWIESTTAGLVALGHEVITADMNSGLSAILREPSGEFVAGVDPRREGIALGD
jgi:gamma-glutamyltranspeptidase / glutathione hydrolase